MPKISRPLKSSAKTTKAPAKQGNTVLLLGIALAILVAGLVFASVVQTQRKGTVLVAKQNISTFSVINPSMLVSQEVPQDSITENDLTADEMRKITEKGEAITSTTILAGQRISRQAITGSNQGALSAVSDDERVIAMPSTLAGAGAGVIAPGSVVDVFGSGSGGESTNVVSDAKVLAIGPGASATENVRPASEDKQAKSSQEGGGSFIVLLAVPKDSASLLVGVSQVHLALSANRIFDVNGEIVELSQATTNDNTSTDPTDGSADDTSSASTTEATPADDAAATENTTD